MNQSGKCLSLLSLGLILSVSETVAQVIEDPVNKKLIRFSPRTTKQIRRAAQ